MVNHDIAQQKYSERTDKKSLSRKEVNISVYPCRLQPINHNNENISSDLTQPSQDITSPTQHQFTNPTNLIPIQQTTYESDINKDW